MTFHPELIRNPILRRLAYFWYPLLRDLERKEKGVASRTRHIEGERSDDWDWQDRTG